MTKTYKLLPSEAKDDQKTIVISEEVTETKTNEERVTIAQLKERLTKKSEQIENLKKEANKIVDQLTEINNNTSINITVKSIPAKL